MKRIKKIIIPLMLGPIIISCGQDPLPKPKAFLRLEYPSPVYNIYKSDWPVTFEYNTLVEATPQNRTGGPLEYKGLDLKYPLLKGTIYLTFKKINAPSDLTTYFRDAQKFTQEHTRKADEITEQVFADNVQKTFGMFFEVGGNAASQAQFYLTDSTRHFLSGSLYFEAKPNFDSILPAAEYIKRDIRHLMETVTWE